MVNLVEYALNMTPTVADPSGLPSVAISEVGGTESVVMTYSPNPEATDVSLQPESSGDLTLWSAVNPAAGDGNSVSASVPLGDGAPVYLRLRVNRQ